MDGATGAGLWSLAGSVYALAGAALLWSGVVAAQKPASLLAATSTRDASSQLDARIGAALLTIGFFMQASGAVGGARLHGPAVLLLVALAAGLLFYGVGKDVLIDAAADPDASNLPVPALEAPSKRILIAQAEETAEVTDIRPTPLRQIN